MAGDSGFKYRAFISYSHDDEAWARWLQRSLERYRVPRRLRAEHPELPKRLYPVFRDREELASSTDLSESIQQHMAQSEALIVVCSPSAAQSRWVNEEIRHYRSMGRADRIFCLMVAGSPERAAPDCAFPPALLEADDGTPLPEPLAADVHGDGKRGALLKIAAGLLGVGIDDLRQRDAQRQVRTWSAIAVGSMAIAVLTIGLAIVAYLAREESELRRGQAEDLISFMLGDLRSRLAPVGRLDVLDAVGDQAMDYFAALGDRGTEDEVMARAMALRQIGEVRFAQGQLEPALEAFTESRDIARALHEAHPANNDYLFELGQAEFWVGYVALERNDLPGAAMAFGAYHEVSRDLAERDPTDPDYQMELLFAASNLGTVALEQGRFEDAIDHFSESVRINRALLEDAPGDDTLRFELANGLSWLGSAHLSAADLAASQAAFEDTLQVLRPLHASGKDPRYSNEFADNAMLLADVQLHRGDQAAAANSMQIALPTYQALVARDETNARWAEALYRAQQRQGELAMLNGDLAAAEPDLRSSARGLEALYQADTTDVALLQRLARVEATLALLWAKAGEHDQARPLAEVSQSRSRAALVEGSGAQKQLREAAEVQLWTGDAFQAVGLDDHAANSWIAGLAVMEEDDSGSPILLAIRAALLRRLGQERDAAELEKTLDAIGFVDPRYRPSG